MKKQKWKKIKIKRTRSTLKRKALLLLQAGFALGLTPSPRAHGYVLRELAKEWKEINDEYLKRIIQEFRYEKLVSWYEKPDGTVKIVLSKKGKRRALEYKIHEMKIKKPNKWDRKWRVVMFDIPEGKRSARDALRNKLRKLGFEELQKSIFVYPFPCQNEIDFIIEFFEIRNCVRYAEVTNITNEKDLKLCFGLK